MQPHNRVINVKREYIVTAAIPIGHLVRIGRKTSCDLVIDDAHISGTGGPNIYTSTILVSSTRPSRPTVAWQGSDAGGTGGCYRDGAYIYIYTHTH